MVIGVDQNDIWLGLLGSISCLQRGERSKQKGDEVWEFAFHELGVPFQIILLPKS